MDIMRLIAIKYFNRLTALIYCKRLSLTSITVYITIKDAFKSFRNPTQLSKDCEMLTYLIILVKM